jgi:hypothetical protein
MPKDMNIQRTVQCFQICRKLGAAVFGHSWGLLRSDLMKIRVRLCGSRAIGHSSFAATYFGIGAVIRSEVAKCKVNMQTNQERQFCMQDNEAMLLVIRLMSKKRRIDTAKQETEIHWADWRRSDIERINRIKVSSFISGWSGIEGADQKLSLALSRGWKSLSPFSIHSNRVSRWIQCSLWLGGCAFCFGYPKWKVNEPNIFVGIWKQYFQWMVSTHPWDHDGKTVPNGPQNLSGCQNPEKYCCPPIA